MPKPYVSFADLSAKTLLYQGLDRQGALKFHTNIGRIFNKNTFLQSNILLALALTSLCRETGQGKVFWLPECEARLHTEDTVFHCLQQLIFVPFVWGEEDKSQWDDIPYTHRWQILNAKAGGIRRRDVVLPVELVFTPYKTEEESKFSLDVFVAQHTGCKAMLVIAPKTQLRWNVDFVAAAELVLTDRTPKRGRTALQLKKEGLQDIIDICDTLHTNEADATVRDGPDLVTRLWHMFFEMKPGSLILFGQLLARELVWRGVVSS